MKTINEVAEIFGVCRNTVRNWIERGLIKAVKIGGSVRISNEEVERLKRGEQHGKAKSG